MSFRILYVCTHNRCRSILAEAVSNHLGGGQILAASAGSHPVTNVHPLSIRFLRERQIPTRGLHSKSWEDLAEFSPQAIITLCDSAAAETCPPVFGASIRQHWPLQDPSATPDCQQTSAGTTKDAAGGGQGELSDARTAFFTTIDILELRVKRLLEQELADISETELALQLRALARLY